jgi:hypothetical protein
MHEISPVLSGKYDARDYIPAAANINLAATTDASNAPTNTTSVTGISDSTSSSYIDPRRYSKFDRSASQVADAPDFSFHDFLDLVNPLQHIPVISSVYRAATGNTINPVSRVAGDILYGGTLGAVSAVISGAGAVADAVSESQNGHDKTGAVLASLFGADKSDTQVAQAGAAPTTATTAQPISQTADQNLALAAAVNSAPASTPANSGAITMAPLPNVPATAATAATTSTAANAAAPLMQAKAFPLTRQAYGGVMAPPMSMADQNRIIALSQGSHAMRLGNTIYTSPLMNGPHPLPVAAPTPSPTAGDVATTSPTSVATASTTTASTNTPTAKVASIPTGTATTATDNSLTPAMALKANSNIVSAGQPNALPQNLIDDMVMMKALGQYKGVAAGPSSPIGSSLDVSN